MEIILIVIAAMFTFAWLFELDIYDFIVILEGRR